MIDHYTYRVTWSPHDDEHVGVSLNRLVSARLAK